MRRQGPLTIRHMIVAALVVVVVNAQLTWWVIYVLRENRNRLDLERAQITAACERMRDCVGARLDGAEAVVAVALSSGRRPSRDPAPEPFTTWSAAAGAACDGGWRLAENSLVLQLPAGGECVVAVAAQDFNHALLEAPEHVEVGLAEGGSRSVVPESAQVALPAPFEGMVVRPQQARWQEVLEGYRGRIKMVLSEAAFFALLLFVMIGLLWKTMRREVELERQHRNFLSAITHELKSPLAAMRLSLETVLRGRADGTASVRFLENALQDTERLQSLVQKVLEVTRYGRGDGTLNVRRNCLSEVVEYCLATFSRRATSAGARVDTEITSDVWVEMDEEAFAIVISNLLENAIKYGGTIPRVAVRVWVEDETAWVDVGDNGKGIAEEDVPFIFNRFFRGGDEMTRTTQGTGLGLYLVRQIVAAHSGIVEVHSTGPEGTTFRVGLPHGEVWEDNA